LEAANAHFSLILFTEKVYKFTGGKLRNPTQENALEFQRFSLPTVLCRWPIAHCALVASCTAVLLALTMPAAAAPARSQDAKAEPAQVRTEIPYQDGKITLLSDSLQIIGKSTYRAKGHVQITFQDILVTGEEAQYDKETREAFITGKPRFSQKEQWLTCSRVEFNFGTRTGTFYDASGYTDRQFFITGRTIRKTGLDTYSIEEGLVTACQSSRPKWLFSASRTNLRLDHTARLHHTVFKIKGIPVFYTPFLVMPLEKKERSSGFIPFHTGNSTSKGRVLSEGYYQTLGKSADALIYGDYFSLRGLAVGGIFRAKPNPDTWFRLEAYGLKDKLDQGGVQLTVDGESRLKDDWRAVARVNITSNFRFRQAFADSFRSATIPQERATAFLTRDHNSISTNIGFERQEVLFPIHSLVIRKLPSLEFVSLGMPLGKTPFVFSFRTSLEGMSRTDSLMQTQQLVQRLDFYPHISVRLPVFKGFSLVPTVGVRETYYGAQQSEQSASGVVNRSLHRHYADLTLDFRTPVLEKDFHSSWLGDMQHTIEPFITYRWIRGIDDFEKIIRFDEQDAIAATNEVEYGIVNRFHRSRAKEGGATENQEFMSFALVQKYFFDPTFGGAFRPGQLNSFYPLDTVTGFYQTGNLSNLAPLSAIFQLSPRNGIHNDLRLDFDARHQRWRNESLSTLWQQGKLALSGTYFRTQATEAGLTARDHVQGQIWYGHADKGLSSGVALSYNLKTGQLLNSNTRVNYTWDCCGVTLEFNQFDLGLRIESRFSFSFTLKGIGSFGNLKRPETIF
jgi:LPS-assembly protein